MKTAIEKKKSVKKTTRPADAYDDFKTFRGKMYTGMPIGRTHTWHYDRGDWKEKKLAPDRWEISYAVTKRRVGKAPEGSGVPVGTGYHWFILSHQFVHKLNADDYSTVMSGIKLKLAHKRADKAGWNASAARQAKILTEALEQLIAQIKKNPLLMQVIPLSFSDGTRTYQGTAVPVFDSCTNVFCSELDITLNDKHLGVIHLTKNGWRLPKPATQKVATLIGRQLETWFEEHT